MEDRFASIKEKVVQFRDARDWKQFHDPKNLSEAICVEAAELLERFLWKTREEGQSLSDADLKGVREEVADVMIFLICLSDVLGIDLLDAAEAKLKLNEAKYPQDRARGTSKKYTEL